MIFRTPHFPPLPARLAASGWLLHAAGRVPGRKDIPRRVSTNALTAWLSATARPAVSRGVRRTGREVARFARESGVPRHWRFLVLLTLLSFATAWMGTKAVMAQFESSWTEAALTVARHENQELRTRQETLREQTEAALADLAAAEGTPAATASRRP